MPALEILYGVNPIQEMLRSGRRRCHEIVLSEGRRASTVEELVEIAKERKVRVSTLPKGDIQRIAGTDRHQGVIARVDPFPYAVLEEMVTTTLATSEKTFFVVLDGIVDPQNLGSIIRTAHLLGVQGIILPKDNACAVTPAAVKASAGAAEYMMIAQVTNISNTIRYLQENGMWTAALAAEGEKSIYDHDFTGYHLVLVLGSEGKGVRRLVREKCDFLLHIPMQGNIDSFNVSVAGALVMGEAVRQRHQKGFAKTVPDEG